MIDVLSFILNLYDYEFQLIFNKKLYLEISIKLI